MRPTDVLEITKELVFAILQMSVGCILRPKLLKNTVSCFYACNSVSLVRTCSSGNSPGCLMAALPAPADASELLTGLGSRLQGKCWG